MTEPDGRVAWTEERPPASRRGAAAPGLASDECQRAAGEGGAVSARPGGEQDRRAPRRRAGQLGFPFSAIVGMDGLRLALVLNAVSPAIGGVLVRGEKGTAKSTMVRGLAAVLPEVEVVTGCRFCCDPGDADPACPDGPHEPGAPARARPARLVELPVGASEDRLIGALDIERALTEGVKAYEPGLLAAAHRGVLYVDEVNLLPDHLVDLLLDASALGTCYVERDGVSVRHAAKFLLVGTMNPEEGELRPQLLDRFGLSVEAAAPRDLEQRAEVVRRRLASDADPVGFAARWSGAEAALAARIAAARRRLAGVALPDEALRQIAAVCAALDVDGLRADLVTARAALAHAAWQGRDAVTSEDIGAAARLALPHRRRRQPFDTPQLAEEELERALSEGRAAAGAGSGGRAAGDPGRGARDVDQVRGGGPDARRGPGRQGDAGAADRCEPHSGGPGASDGLDGPGPSDGATEGVGPDGPGPDDGGPGGRGPDDGGPDGRGPGAARRAPGSMAGAGGSAGPAGEGESGNAARRSATAPPGAVFRPRRLEVPGIGMGAAGRRSRARTDAGRVTGARVPQGRLSRVHLTATLAAAAPHQFARDRAAAGRLVLRRDDLREPRLEGRETNLVLFVVDASGSMAAQARMSAVKGAVLSLLLDAYQRRDKAGVITFRGAGAEVLLPPTASVEAAAARLAAMPAGGRTPLAAGLLRAREVLHAERVRDPRRRPLLVVVTDGRATVGPDPVGAARRAAVLLNAAGVASVVVDCESGPVRLGLAADLAVALGGTVRRLAELAAGPLADSVRELREVA